MTREYESAGWDGSTHPVSYFREVLATLRDEDWPDGVVPVDPLIDGTAFFAASWGLVIDRATRKAMHHGGSPPPFPFGGVMLVGHNLDGTESYFERVAGGRAHGDPDGPDMSTWRRLYTIFELAGITRAHFGDFFCTNVYVGLKQGHPQGAFPGRHEPGFVSWCAAFLAEQIAVMRPRAVVTLGAPAAKFVAAMDIPTFVVGIEHPSSRGIHRQMPDGRRHIDIAAETLRAAFVVS